MAEVVNNNITVINQNDPDIPEYLDFEKLRKEGLEHIGSLSGKIWTDHNTHDPGITILEMLVYALMDLGYKTNLPFEDLIAVQNNSEDDNFLTPLDILTINPVTITDYRKLLLEVKGVRNAWLEPVRQERDLFLDGYSNTLFCDGGIIDVRKESNDLKRRNGYQKIELNGLYQVYIEKDNEVVNDNLEDDIKTLLSQHRNLCEDFVGIEILAPIEIGVCVEVEIHADFEAEKVYAEVFTKIKNYIQPEIKYYTLQELLDKGKTIDDIFAGRPYLEESFGFVDTEELEGFDRRDRIYLSDLYHTILSIDGVRKIKNIAVKGNSGLIKISEWEYKIEENNVPVFSLEKTCIDLYNVNGSLRVDKPKIHRAFSILKQFEMPMDSLNTKIPGGVCRDDLEEYFSIQNDFPVVYGIGEDGLPESSTLLRKTQALQLKGYLMFYDQMLANYTSQLSNIRSLFSLKVEKERTKEEKRTYFTQIPDSIPNFEKLLRFYDNGDSVSGGSLLAVPVANDEKWKDVLDQLKNNSSIELTIDNYCNDNNALLELFSVPSAGLRTIYINQLVDSFFNNNFNIEVLADRRGYFFVIQATLPNDIVIVGTRRYSSSIEAQQEAKNIAFIASMSKNYNLITNASEDLTADQHYFGIIFTPLSYIDIIQELTENKDEYVIRRKQFLDHLLARFGEEFTDYTILQYQNKINTQNHVQDEIDDQSKYINEFAEVSRNRGKAFNYLEPSWNTDNVSGFEKRIALLSGIGNYQRRNLCNFEVIQNFRIILKDWSGNVLFKSNRGYENIEELHGTARKILGQLRNPESYKRLEKDLNGFDPSAIHRIFSEKPADENIIITSHNYHQELRNTHDEVVVLSKSTKMKSEKAAIDKKDVFITDINKQNLIVDKEDKKEFRLLPLEKENSYLDVNALPCNIETLITWKWHVNDNNAKEKTTSEQVFEEYDEAWNNMVREAKLGNYLTTHEAGVKWRLGIDENISILGLDCYPDGYKAVTAWRQAKVLGSAKTNYFLEKEEDFIRVKLKNEKGNAIAISNKIGLADCNIDTVIEDCVAVFSNRITKPEYDNEKDKFGFQVLGKDKVQILKSYCVYGSEKEALQQLETVFKFGVSKKNYLLSGDQGNPEYNYILLDQYNSFLALPPDHFETATDRSKALNVVMRYFKNNTLPVYVREQPRRYIWSLLKDEEKVLKSQSEFSSKARAQADFDKTVQVEAQKPNNEIFVPYCYDFAIVATPSQYKFIYGISNEQNDLEPLFISTNTFKTDENASTAYTEFVRNLPGVIFKVSPRSDNEYGLYLSGSETPLAGGYQKEKPSLEKARALVSYISKIYTKKLTPRENFVTQEMVENQSGGYEWRLYKKNAPLAINPNTFSEEAQAERIKAIICDIIPPIDLRQCPKKSVVVCPEGSPNRYHYQVEFNDIYNKEFILISYVGYGSALEAEEAWSKQWLDVIQLATHREEYTSSGKINVEEVYKDPESKSCDNESFLVVIPKKIRDAVEASGDDIVSHYCRSANLYPIYTASEENNTGDLTYKYRVVIPQNTIVIGDSPRRAEDDHFRNIIWESEGCYDNVQEAIDAYIYFYNLAGTSNNCRVFCDKGDFYVGLVEVLAESSQDFDAPEKAWDDVFSDDNQDSCGNCIPGGVREFIYAAEDDKNYITICEQECWKFKVVSPGYFVVDHSCYYDSKVIRDDQINQWVLKLKNLNWDEYITGKPSDGGGTRPGSDFLFWIGYGYSEEEFCDFMFCLRDSLNICATKDDEARNQAIKSFLKEKYKDDTRVYNLIDQYDFKHDVVKDLASHFPIYKTDNGYGYRLYDVKNDIDITPDGLQPCGCEPDVAGEIKPCNDPYPFVSSNNYSCRTEALQAFLEFCILINDTDRSYSIECISKSEYGPYSFQIVDKSKELAYHPQQYDSLQEVKDAIEVTKDCVTDVGMHLLEHILLRPKPGTICGEGYDYDGEGEYNYNSCLLPVCPDYDCCIEWQLDLDEGDPCSGTDNAPKINYIPGSDPYSFWATLILPAWSKRFRTQEKREAFEDFLYKEVPALVGLNILWLSPSNLCKFEDAYHKWLLWLQDPDPDKDRKRCNPNETLPYCLVSNCIRDLESEPPCSSIPDEGGDCNCNDDGKIIPEESSGSIFWGNCTDIFDQNYEQASVSEVSIKDEVAKADLEKLKTENKENTKAKQKTKEESEKKPTVKSARKTTKKKVTKKKITHSKPKKDDLAVIRKRKPKYISNAQAIANDSMKKTKSYDRAMFFLQNIPTITEYNKLVDFFDRYSLQKDNDQNFMVLIKNATWHLFDKLVLDEKEEISKENIDHLQKRLKNLKDKGLSLKELDKEWNSAALGAKANKKPLAQLKKIVK
ncbi:hypothetical protein [Aquimarina sp. MMG016]|uniref:hypothetical protein n=1 Tax=Aquimarina sp. MMG016 TaxID=2822690 RepID=UPI001B3A783E|nr:hypothetical protein [Aquimarina sp. MMG016]MBQ4818577.1 hypothetical protein [Aquimarina sp. MMG016]